MSWAAFPLMGIQRIEGYDRLTFQWWWIGAGIAALMILLALWRCLVLAIGWWSKPGDNPRKLYRCLVRIHKLNSQERRLMGAMASLLPKHTPEAILFVDPSVWQLSQIQELDTVESQRKLFEKIFGMEPD